MKIESKKVIDLTNQTFGRLRVIEYMGLNKRGALWKCQCECGNEKIIEGRSLRCGNTLSCGCKRTEMYKDRIKDMVGLKFGRLTVIEPAGSSKRGILWRC